MAFTSHRRRISFVANESGSWRCFGMGAEADKVSFQMIMFSDMRLQPVCAYHDHRHSPGSEFVKERHHMSQFQILSVPHICNRKSDLLCLCIGCTPLQDIAQTM